MFSRVRTAIRFFFVGLAVGVLLAPRSGEETRRLLRERADSLLNEVLEAASMGRAAERAPPATARGHREEHRGGRRGDEANPRQRRPVPLELVDNRRQRSRRLTRT